MPIPRGWSALGRSDAVFPGVIETLGRVDHSLVPPLVGLTMAESPLKLFAFELAQRGSAPPATIQVLVEDGPPLSLAGLAREVRATAARVSGRRGPLLVGRLSLPTGSAVRASYRRTVVSELRRSEVWTMQVYVPVAGRTYALIFTAPAERRARYRPLFESAVRALRLTGG
jgi:hypothetical protein